MVVQGQDGSERYIGRHKMYLELEVILYLVHDEDRSKVVDGMSIVRGMLQ